MSKFLFVVHDNNNSHATVEHELADVAAARREAIRALTELASDELPQDGDRQSMWISVSDASGIELLTVSIDFQVTRSNGLPDAET